MNLLGYLKQAKKQGWAIGQFNFSTLEQLKGVTNAAGKMKAPIIIGTSEKESLFFGPEEAVAVKKVMEKKWGRPFFLHLDHGRDLAYIDKVIKAGYDSIHFDGSALPLEENIRQTKIAAVMTRKKGIVVEGELGILRGESVVSKIGVKPEIKQGDLTDIDSVIEFVEKTKVDSLAVCIGNIHGIYKRMPELDFARLKKIRSVIQAFLVFHGGSGFASAELRKAITCGVQKININTELRVAWKKVLVSNLKKESADKPYFILQGASEAVEKKTAEYIKIFNSSGKI